MDTRRPNLFIVGAPKCGTTSMHRYLDQHPSIFMSVEKEPHTFSNDVQMKRHWRICDPAAYAALFAEASSERYVGESSSSYLYSRNAVRRIAEMSDDAQIIIMVRTPADMVRSAHWQWLRDGNEVVPDLRRALDLEEARQRGESIPDSTYWPWALRYTELVNFPQHIQRYLDAFGEERVKIVLFRDLKSDTSKMVADVLAFLGLEPTPDLDTRVHNQAATARNLPVRRFLLRHPGFRSSLRALPRPLRRGIGNALAPFMKRRPPDGTMDPRLREELFDRFLPIAEEMEAILGRELPHWKPARAGLA